MIQQFDPQVERIEPAVFSGGGSYDGVESAKHYLAQSRAGVAQVISEPDQFISAEDRIVVFVHVRVLPKDSNTWQDIRLADVYTFKTVGQRKWVHLQTERTRYAGLALATSRSRP